MKLVRRAAAEWWWQTPEERADFRRSYLLAQPWYARGFAWLSLTVTGWMIRRTAPKVAADHGWNWAEEE